MELLRVMAKGVAQRAPIFETGEAGAGNPLLSVAGGHDGQAKSRRDHLQHALVIGGAEREMRPDPAFGEMAARFGKRFAMAADDHDFGREVFGGDLRPRCEWMIAAEGQRKTLFHQRLLQKAIRAPADQRNGDVDPSARKVSDQFPLTAIDELHGSVRRNAVRFANSVGDQRAGDAVQDAEAQNGFGTGSDHGLLGQVELPFYAACMGKETRSRLSELYPLIGPEEQGRTQGAFQLGDADG